MIRASFSSILPDDFREKEKRELSLLSREKVWRLVEAVFIYILNEILSIVSVAVRTPRANERNVWADAAPAAATVH